MVEDLKNWVRMGAPDPRRRAAIAEVEPWGVDTATGVEKGGSAAAPLSAGTSAGVAAKS